MAKIHLITGGTGFIGSKLILELLTQTDDEIICIVRKSEEETEKRLFSCLRKAADVYNYDKDILQEAQKRCKAVPGNVEADYCGLKNALHDNISYFWHSAANLRYQKKYQKEIFNANVNGTQNALNLAKSLNVECFYYISTAYVSGKNFGEIKEDYISDSGYNNYYELSKASAEKIIYNTQGINWKILRPSIVIGHSSTFGATAFSGIYAFLKILIKFENNVHAKKPGFLNNEGIKMLVDQKFYLNLVPIDIVVKEAIMIFKSSSPERFFHLVNPTPPQITTLVNATFDVINLKRPLLCTTKEQFTATDEELNKKMDFFNPYLIGNRLFNRKNTKQAIGTQKFWNGESFSNSKLQSYYRWYLNNIVVRFIEYITNKPIN